MQKNIPDLRQDMNVNIQEQMNFKQNKPEDPHHGTL